MSAPCVNSYLLVIRIRKSIKATQRWSKGSEMMANEKEVEIYKIYIHPSDLKELRRDIWIDDPVPASLSVKQNKYEIDIAYRGSHIRDFKKKSYLIKLYKPPVFRGAKEFHLNAEYKDPSLIRNKLSFDFFQEIGVLAPFSEHVYVYINGKPEGLYLKIESVNREFLSRRGLPSGPIFYAVDGDANFSLMSEMDMKAKHSLSLGYEQKNGTNKDYIDLQNLIFTVNTAGSRDFEAAVSKLIDIEQYLRWLAGVILTQNYDGFVHNYALYKNSETGLYEIIPWDYDATWGRDVNGKEMSGDYVRIEGFNTLTARIMSVAAFRSRYKQLLEHLLQNIFTVQHLQPKVAELHSAIRPYVLKDPYLKDRIVQFDAEPAFISSYIKERHDYVERKLSSWK